MKNWHWDHNAPSMHPGGKRYVDDVISITIKDKVDILFNHINQLDEYIKFTMESPDNVGSIPFLDTKCIPDSNHTIHTIVYRQPTHTDRYLDWNSNHQISGKRSVIQALTHRAKVVCSTPELLAREMDYRNKVLCRNSYLHWLLKKTNNRSQGDQAPTRETTKEAFVSVPYFRGMSEEFRRINKNTKVQIIFKWCNTLKTLLMHPKDKIPKQPHQDVVYQWTCPEENCNSSYIVESSRCLESRVKEHKTSSNSTIFQYSITHKHPKADISEFTIIDQDKKQVTREASEAIHMRKNNPALSHNIGKMNIP